MNDLTPFFLILFLAALIWALIIHPKTTKTNVANGQPARSNAEDEGQEKELCELQIDELATTFVELDKQASVVTTENEIANGDDATTINQDLLKSLDIEAERNDLIKSIRSKAPNSILKAKLEFEREYRSSGGVLNFSHEMSPLVCFGYHVGKTNGRTVSDRHAILEYALAADLDSALPFLPFSYRKEWGSPLSMERLNRIFHHLNGMANLAELRDDQSNLDVAVAQWRADAAWVNEQQRPIVEKYSEI